MSYNSGITGNLSQTFYNRGEKPPEIRPTKPFDDPPPIVASAQKIRILAARSSIWYRPPQPKDPMAEPLVSLETKTIEKDHAPVLFYVSHKPWTEEENQKLLAAVSQEMPQRRRGNRTRGFEAFYKTHPHRTFGAIEKQYNKLMRNLHPSSLKTTPPPLLYRGDNPEANRQIRESVQSVPLPPPMALKEDEDSESSISLQIDTRPPAQWEPSVSTADTRNAPQKRKRGDDPDDEEGGKPSSTIQTLTAESAKSTSSSSFPHLSWEKLQEFFLTNNKKCLQQISSHVRQPLELVQDVFLEECQTLLQDPMKRKGTATDTQNPTDVRVSDLQKIMETASQKTLHRMERSLLRMPGKICSLLDLRSVPIKGTLFPNMTVTKLVQVKTVQSVPLPVVPVREPLPEPCSPPLKELR